LKRLAGVRVAGDEELREETRAAGRDGEGDETGDGEEVERREAKGSSLREGLWECFLTLLGLTGVRPEGREADLDPCLTLEEDFLEPLFEEELEAQSLSLSRSASDSLFVFLLFFFFFLEEPEASPF
jgi:hypothetical protein